MSKDTINITSNCIHSHPINSLLLLRWDLYTHWLSIQWTTTTSTLFTLPTGPTSPPRPPGDQRLGMWLLWWLVSAHSTCGCRWRTISSWFIKQINETLLVLTDYLEWAKTTVYIYIALNFHSTIISEFRDLTFSRKLSWIINISFRSKDKEIFTKFLDHKNLVVDTLMR